MKGSRPVHPDHLWFCASFFSGLPNNLKPIEARSIQTTDFLCTIIYIYIYGYKKYIYIYGFLARTLKRFFSYILEIHIQLLFSTNKKKKKKSKFALCSIELSHQQKKGVGKKSTFNLVTNKYHFHIYGKSTMAE